MPEEEEIEQMFVAAFTRLIKIPRPIQRERILKNIEDTVKHIREKGK